jgi:hypothetical protein
MPAKPAPHLTVLSRSGCHLCEEMIAGLQALKASHRFDFSVVDVGSVAALEERYGEHIPVLLHDTRELCRHRLEVARVTDYLTRIG